jgi:hypothetical protein
MEGTFKSFLEALETMHVQILRKDLLFGLLCTFKLVLHLPLLLYPQEAPESFTFMRV